jgi:hypothetical protein
LYPLNGALLSGDVSWWLKADFYNSLNTFLESCYFGKEIVLRLSILDRKRSSVSAEILSLEIIIAFTGLV